VIVDVHAHVIVAEVTRDWRPAGAGHPRPTGPAGGGPGAAAGAGGGLPEAWRPAVRRDGGGQLVEFRGRSIRAAVGEFVDVDRMLEEAAACGVDRLVLSPWVNLLPYDLDPPAALHACQVQNDALAERCAAHPGRVSALGAVPLQDPTAAAAELERLLGERVLGGVEVAASVAGAFIGDDRFLPFWEAAEATAAVVLVHPTTRGFDLPVLQQHYLWNTVGNPLETAVAGAHLVMAGVLERFPRLRVVLAHGGGALLSLRGRLRKAHSFQPQARARLAGTPDASLRRLHYDTVTHDATLLAALVHYAGAGQVLLGSDRPFDMGTADPVGEVRALGLDAQAERAVLGGNAAALLGLGAGTGTGPAGAAP
jgi:aminocarboxymuconate-semialdehyde decarboxylase